MLSDRITPTNRFSNRPLYLQLRDALAERIAGGNWKPGSAIPNESDLAREFGVSAGTMRKALDMMEGERLLTRRQGRGTFVNDQTSDELAMRFSKLRAADGARISGQIKHLEISEGKANEFECKRLRLRSDDRVYRMNRVLHLDGKNFLFEEVSLPAALFPGLSEVGEGAERIIGLAQEFGILLGKAEERISLSTASSTVASTLGVAPGSPILLLDRVVMALDGRPVEWRLGHCHLADNTYYLAEMV